MSTIESYLSSQRVKRNDVGSYVGNLLIRQRLVNETVVAFVEDQIPTKGVVIDACAGPEGSLLAASLRGYQWFGNDISSRFSHNLAQSGAQGKIVLSDFENAPFQSESADAVLFIFALNNFSNPGKAMAEAARVVRPGGIVVEAETGITKAVSNSVLFGLGKRYNSWVISDVINQSKSFNGTRDFFEELPYSPESYAEHVIRGSLGVETDQVVSETRGLLPRFRRSTQMSFFFYEYMQRKYFENIHQAAQRAGLNFVKVGFVAAGETQGSWQVTTPLETTSAQVIEDIVDWKKSSKRLTNQIPDWDSVASVENRLTFPILCYKKS